MSDKVEIYTDGACKGNPGPGGIGIILKKGSTIKELSSGFLETTNNRMELMAAIVGISALKKECEAELFTDSKYLVESMEQGWVLKWKANGWHKKKNSDLWEQILMLCQKHTLKFTWVKGHAENQFNNRCDQLAVEASNGKLFPDKGYEDNIKRQKAQMTLSI